MLILLTACIQPHDNITMLKISDPQLRLQQYRKALIYWISQTAIEKIVFCDNSNYQFDVTEFEQLAQRCAKQIEFLRFSGNKEKVIECGKGYGEGEIIQYFIENSHLLKGETHFLKITGRVIVENFGDLYPYIQNKPANYFNASRIFDRRRSANTVFFMVNVDIYKKYLMAVFRKVRDDQGIVFEKLIRQALLKNNVLTENFPTYPLIDGMEAGTGMPYKKQPQREWYRKWFSQCHFYDLKSW